MSKQYFVYVFAPVGSVYPPAKIGITCDPRQRKHKLNRSMRESLDLRFYQPGDFRWMARVDGEQAALAIERSVKQAIGRPYQNTNDWIDTSPERVARVANDIAGEFDG